MSYATMPTVEVACLDGTEEISRHSIEHFCRVNRDAPEVCEEVRRLKVNDQIIVGGGAAVPYVVRRIS